LVGSRFLCGVHYLAEIFKLGHYPQPGDFDAQLKLAEVFAVYCKDMMRAERILRRIELGASFSPQQLAGAREKFRTWQSIETNPRAF
jgi:hypothetical protein